MTAPPDDSKRAMTIHPGAGAIPTMNYQVTVRYGRKRQRYFSVTVSTENLAGALRQASAELPEEVAAEADLVEIREAPDFDKAFEGSE